MRRRLVSRLKEGRCPSVAGAFPLPKPGKDEVRKMAWLNIYDDLYFRIIVGRTATATDSALGSDVFSYRLEDRSHGWTVQEVKQANEQRRERGEALLADGRCNAMAISDIRRYYPSITPEVIVEVLDEIGSPPGAVEADRQLPR